ncbi:MAG: hypothetical protein EXR72_10960 [Myxococcales bacterium]|nr:hypothetical protein [Myxococcales bacterium]
MNKLLLALLLGLAGCPKSPSAEVAGPKECASNIDCPRGWVCLAKKCANATHGAIFTDTSNAVTPGKVKDEVEQQLKAHDDKMDNLMKKAAEQQ